MTRARWRVISRSFAWKSLGFVGALAGCQQAQEDAPELVSQRQAMMDDGSINCSNCLGGECAELHCFEDWTHGGGGGGPYDGPPCGNAPSCDSGGGGWDDGEDPSDSECRDYFYDQCKGYPSTDCRYRPERPPRTGGHIIADAIFGGALSEIDRLYPSPEPRHTAQECYECTMDFAYDVAQCMRGWECGGTVSGSTINAQAGAIFGDCNQSRPHSSFRLVPSKGGHGATLGDFNAWADIEDMQMITGDFDGNGHLDAALLGASSFSTIPVVFSGGPSLTVSNLANSAFTTWASASGALLLAGDFTGDGRTDLAVTGAAGLSVVPVALSNGDGSFTVEQRAVGSFAGWAATAGVKAVAGDFNGDGLDDIALTGGAGWTTVPVATASAAGFSISNHAAGSFASAAVGARSVAADFSGDGKDDIVLLKTEGDTLPVATSVGGGSFSFSDANVGAFAGWARQSTARFMVGDFSGDGRADIALTGVSGWTTIPLATSTGSGAFSITNQVAAEFAGWSSDGTVAVASGDFNGDGRTDLAARAPSWTSPRIVYAHAGGVFNSSRFDTVIRGEIRSGTIGVRR
jgi:hypothetical protein